MADSPYYQTVDLSAMQIQPLECVTPEPSARSANLSTTTMREFRHELSNQILLLISSIISMQN